MAEAYTPEVQEALRLKSSLAEFVKAAWPVVEGSRALKWNWHLETICNHLQAAFEGRIPSKIIFNVPPRASKSTIVSVMFPAWAWAKKSWLQFMFASHKIELARDFAYKRRAILESDWYKSLFGEDVHLKVDRNSIVEIATEDQGVMYTTSAGGSVTGRGADILIQDDPNNAEEMESELERASKLRWVDVTWSNRANDPAKVMHFVIQQRTHTEDISGHLLSQGGWLHVKIPMEFNPDKKSITPIWSDPRTAKGELLDAERFPAAYLVHQKVALGPYFYAGQYDQEPYPLGGGIFKAGWFSHRWTRDKNDPKYICLTDSVTPYRFDQGKIFRFMIADLAITEKQIADKKLSDPDYTALGVFGAWPTPRGPLIILLDMIRERLDGPSIISRMAALHAHWNFAFMGIESVAAQSYILQYAKREGLPVREISAKKDEDTLYFIDKDKVGRAMAATPLLADHRFFIPEYSPWLGDYLTELLAFPNAPHDDMVDVTSYSVAIVDKYRGELTSGPTMDSVPYVSQDRGERDPERDAYQPDPIRAGMPAPPQNLFWNRGR